MLSRPETAASTVVPRWGDTMTRALNLKPAALTFAVAGTIAIATVGPATSSERPAKQIPIQGIDRQAVSSNSQHARPAMHSSAGTNAIISVPVRGDK